MPGGRPSSYTPEVAARVCELLCEGKSLRQVTMTPGMPARDTILRWAEQSPEFQVQLARARETSADFHADEGLRVLQDAMGRPKEEVAAARELARYHMGLARVIDQKNYGDRAHMAVEHSGQVNQGLVVNFVVGRAEDAGKAIDVEPVKAAISQGSNDG